MSNVQLNVSKIFDSQMQINTGNHNNDVNLAKEFQQYLTKEHSKNGVFDQGKNDKLFMERKWIDRQYNIQDNSNVSHTDVRMYCNKNKFPALPFCGPHSKPHGARGMSKHYHLRFDPKLGNGACAIFRIPCACVAFTSMLYKPWMYGIPSVEKGL